MAQIMFPIHLPILSTESEEVSDAMINNLNARIAILVVKLAAEQHKVKVLTDALEQWKEATRFHQVLFANERRITNEALAAVKEMK